MNYTGNEDHSISLQEAATMTKRYRDNRTAAQTIIGEYFGKDAINDILNQEEVVGIRIYYALDESMVKKLVIVGVDGNGNDVYEGILAEKGHTNPPFGGTPNPLNS